MRILVTRPAADAARTAAALRARGHDPVVAPLLTVEFLSSAELGNGPWAAVLTTSANAARALAAHTRRDELHRIPVFAVGQQTAQEFRTIGFTDVSAADGDGDDLATLVTARLKPPAPLLYLAGEARAGDLAGALGANNFAVHTAVVYRVAVADALPAEAIAALPRLDGVLHYSRRSAEGFLAAAGNSGLLEAVLSQPVHYCLSTQVGAPFKEAGAVDVRIAERPEEASLLALCG